MGLEAFRDYVLYQCSDFNIREIEVFKVAHTGQHFAAVVVEKDGSYSGFLVADERHRGKQEVRSEKCDQFYVHKRTFRHHLDANNGCQQLQDDLNELIKDDQNSKNFAFRVYNTGRECYYYPDKYLVKGDVIQRDLKGGLPASHEGIYIGNGMVIHNTNGKNICKTTLKEFAGGPDVQIRVVDYCIRRKTPDETCILANAFLKIDRKYNVVWNNCQHFTSLCATGVEFMTDRRQLTEKIVVSGIIITVVAQGTLHNLAKNKKEVDGITILMATAEAIADYYLVITSLVIVANSPLTTKRTRRYSDQSLTESPIYLGTVTNNVGTNIIEPIANGVGVVVEGIADGIRAIGNGIARLFSTQRNTHRNDVLYN